MKLLDIFLAIIITTIWGVNFSFIKLGLTIDPFILSGFRFLLCSFPLVFFIKKPDAKIIYIISYGIFFGVGLWGMVSLGIYFGLSAGLSSLILQLSAFFTVILGVIVFKEKINLFKKIGFLLAVAGLILILNVTNGTGTYMGIILTIFGALNWSIANIIIKKSGTTKVFSFIVWSSLFSPLPLFIISIFTGGLSSFTSIPYHINFVTIISIIFQVYPTTLFGYWVWNSLLKKYPVSSIAPFSLLVPIFGILGSNIIFNEEIDFGKILACLLIIGGLFFSMIGEKIVERYGKTMPGK